MITIAYLDRYKPTEEQMMSACRIRTCRADGAEFIARALSGLVPKGTVLFRGPPLDIAEFARLESACSAVGFNSATSTEAFRVVSDFATYYPLIETTSPAALIVDADLEDAELLVRVLNRRLRFPLFLRSEVESAAKYVGVEGCVLRGPDPAEFARVVASLRLHVPKSRSLILKEMVAIARSAGVGLEYRAICMGGRLLTFDEHSSSIPEPAALKLDEFVGGVLQSLAQGGANGAMFVDVGVAEDGSPLVIECKNFLNGTIRDPRRLGAMLANESWGGS